MKWLHGVSKHPKTFYKEWLKDKGKAGGYISVGILHKPFINQDFIYLEGQRSKHKGEKRDPPFGFSMNDYEAIALASMLTWCVAKRMNEKRCNCERAERKR